MPVPGPSQVPWASHGPPGAPPRCVGLRGAVAPLGQPAAPPFARLRGGGVRQGPRGAPPHPGGSAAIPPPAGTNAPPVGGYAPTGGQALPKANPHANKPTRRSTLNKTAFLFCSITSKSKHHMPRCRGSYEDCVTEQNCGCCSMCPSTDCGSPRELRHITPLTRDNTRRTESCQVTLYLCTSPPLHEHIRHSVYHGHRRRRMVETSPHFLDISVLFHEFHRIDFTE